MNNQSSGLRSELVDIIVGKNGDAYSKAELICQTLESYLPEEKPQTKYMGKQHSLIQGWNDCLNEIKALLRSK